MVASPVGPVPGRAVAPVLAGTRVLVTAQRRAEELATALACRGADVVRAPVLGPGVEIDRSAVVATTRELLGAPPDVVVLTTATGVRTWVEAAASAGIAEELVAVLHDSRLVARGSKTRQALRDLGLATDVVTDGETLREVASHLVTDGLDGARVALQHPGRDEEAVERALLQAGARVVSLPSYRWGPPGDPGAVTTSVRALGRGDFDAVVLTSAPAAERWLEALAGAGALDVVRSRSVAGDLLLAAVGPVTAEPLAYAGLLVRQPSRARLGALVRLVVDGLTSDARSFRTRHGLLRVRAGGATLDHRRLPVAPSGLAVLRRLATSPGRVVSRQELLGALPGGSEDPHRVEVAVARLREALRAAGADARVVRTVVKRGYLLAEETP